MTSFNNKLITPILFQILYMPTGYNAVPISTRLFKWTLIILTHMYKSRYIDTQFLIGIMICPTMYPEYPSIAAICVAPK